MSNRGKLLIVIVSFAILTSVPFIFRKLGTTFDLALKDALKIGDLQTHLPADRTLTTRELFREALNIAVASNVVHAIDPESIEFSVSLNPNEGRASFREVGTKSLLFAHFTLHTNSATVQTVIYRGK